MNFYFDFAKAKAKKICNAFELIYIIESEKVVLQFAYISKHRI